MYSIVAAKGRCGQPKGRTASYMMAIDSNTRPVVSDLRRSGFDVFLELAAAAAAVGIVATTALYYPELPEMIPRHFDVSGVPDRFGGRFPFLFILPTIAVLAYGAFAVLVRRPDRFNYLVPITDQNARAQYGNARQMTLAVRACMLGSFAWIQWARVQTAMGAADGLGRLFLPICLGLMTLIVGAYIVRARRLG